MSGITTITEFLELSGFSIQAFDMGRRVSPLSRETFMDFEHAEAPYPLPLQRMAWFALLLTPAHPGAEPVVWFLRLPLDEQGKLLQAARDDFMHRLVERLGKSRAGVERTPQGIDLALKDNPYTFKPQEERLAVFHAKVARMQGRPPSKFHAHAREYLGGSLGWNQWSFVGYQGIADLAIRCAEGETAELLAAAFRHGPSEPLVALAHCLEHEQPGDALSRSMLERGRRLLLEEEPDLPLLAALIRGLAGAEQAHLRSLLEAVLAHPCGRQIEILAAVSGRAWEVLRETDLAVRFLECLAVNSAGQQAFNQCLADLLFLPGMREPLMQVMRSPARSEELASALGAFLRSIGG